MFLTDETKQAIKEAIKQAGGVRQLASKAGLTNPTIYGLIGENAKFIQDKTLEKLQPFLTASTAGQDSTATAEQVPPAITASYPPIMQAIIDEIAQLTESEQVELYKQLIKANSRG